MNEWIIPQPVPEIEISVSDESVWIEGAGRIAFDPEWKSSSESMLGRLLPILTTQILELDLAESQGDDLRITFTDFANFPENEITAFADLLERSPFSIRIRMISFLGAPNSAFAVEFFLNGREVEPEIRGCFCKNGDKIYLFDAPTFKLLSEIYRFNNLSPAHKQSPDAFRLFGEVKALAEAADVETDGFTTGREIVEPLEIGIQVLEEEGDRISLAPTSETLDEEDFAQKFKRNPDLPQYDVKTKDGRNASVLLTPEVKEVFGRISTAQHLGGAEKAKILSNPEALFDGVSGSVSLKGFSERIQGIGDFPFVSKPFVQKSVTGIFDDVTALNLADRFTAGIKFTYPNGAETEISFDSIEKLEQFSSQVDTARHEGTGYVEFDGKTIQLNQAFVSAFQELTNKFLPKEDNRVEKSEKRGGKYLLILTNEGEVEFESSQRIDHFEGPLADPELPRSLLPSTVLKDHQKRGIAWLQRNFDLGRSGCLLADDMGLGKTLQLLTFLASLIERGGVISETESPEVPPWKPILIVAPVILVENETWISDMRRFFEDEGSIFWPCLTLRGNSLNLLRRVTGRETQIGEATLDITELHKHRVVITNYETVVNYQHSFAKTDWSVIVTDEAQEYKTPSTKVSHALKSLSASFRVACTGTPVETKISDVWNIFDFVEPGKLGSAQDFRSRYEIPLDAETEVTLALQELKEKLQFNTPNAHLLRRDKNELTDLPRKHEHRLECELMPSQRDYHLSLLTRAVVGGAANHPFKLVNEFLRLYQHPSLVPNFQLPDPESAVADCHKLSVLVMKLEEIRGQREKALIFVRTLDMQQILADVLRHRFGLSVNIINGSTKSGLSSKAQPKTRKAIVSRFRESVGFDVLILSPEVAGMGLTLTEANHVFHYGRWWNPAKEAQATDRVFRIGQEKDVHVYHLIAKDPTNEAFATFDQKLDTLLRRRMALAKDFLTPLPAEDELSKEFMSELFSG
ncbi:MAG: DEAD/DEAH box helicase [Chloracidobacterium sp.]|nr:DEAD/DEAH box helicase [Chloracidobacterium sp.]